MAKGGTDAFIQSRVLELLPTHPYDPPLPQGEGPHPSPPHPLAEVAEIINDDLSEEQLGRMIYYTGLDATFPTLTAVVVSGEESLEASTVIKALVIDMIIGYAMRNCQIAHIVAARLEQYEQRCAEAAELGDDGLQ